MEVVSKFNDETKCNLIVIDALLCLQTQSLAVLGDTDTQPK